MTRRLVAACALWALGAGSAALVGCGGPPRPAARFSPDSAVVLIESNVADAELWVDERFVGQVGTLAGGVALPPGTHRIEVRHPRYHTFYQMLTVDPRAQERLEVVLVPVLE